MVARRSRLTPFADQIRVNVDFPDVMCAESFVVKEARRYLANVWLDSDG